VPGNGVYFAIKSDLRLADGMSVEVPVSMRLPGPFIKAAAKTLFQAPLASSGLFCCACFQAHNPNDFGTQRARTIGRRDQMSKPKRPSVLETAFKGIESGLKAVTDNELVKAARNQCGSQSFQSEG